MRFKRGDLPGIVIAALAPAGMVVLILAAYGLWQHEGSPVLGGAAANLALGAGLLAAFSRFIRRWNVLIGLLLALALDIAAIVFAQRSGNDHTALATGLKLLGVALFLGVNATAAIDLLVHGLNPVLVRRDERIAARRAAQQ
ncbi:MAG: hypothetical protein EXR65_05225 [Dehalococcoidia bacterium]|nr:hypothetical protein [Dehalococcoidia bacterium]